VEKWIIEIIEAERQKIALKDSLFNLSSRKVLLFDMWITCGEKQNL
jgi:hypothetical protein